MTTTSQSKYLVNACKAIAINKRPAQLSSHCSVISNFYVRQNIIIISQKPFFTDRFGLYRNFDSTIYVHTSTRDTYMWFFCSIQKYLCILFASLFSSLIFLLIYNGNFPITNFLANWFQNIYTSFMFCVDISNFLLRMT